MTTPEIFQHDCRKEQIRCMNCAKRMRGQHGKQSAERGMYLSLAWQNRKNARAWALQVAK